MVEVVGDGLAYLTGQSGTSLVALFWFMLLFEVPRYALAFAAAAFFAPKTFVPPPRPAPIGRVSVIVAGHNEACCAENCARSLREQSLPPDEIVFVSDGSTDGMPALLRVLKRRGLVDQVHCTDLRGGKSAAINLAELRATGEVIVNVDCDCTFDRQALKTIVAPFGDPRIGAVCGNILVSNPTQGLIAAFQYIEYLISISLGKQAAQLVNQVVCVSGAFGAFRRSALKGVGGLDVGGGEDLDITLRLRNAGWDIHFAPDAICYTDVPPTMMEFSQQRLRWERDALRLRFRKHRDLMSPLSPRFNLIELVHQLEFIIFNIVAAAAFPFYLVWLVVMYGELAPMILLAAQTGLAVLDLATFALAAWATPKARSLPLLPYVLGYSVFNGLFMRFFRLAAYLQEWLFDASSTDSYIPGKVQLLRRW